MRINYLSETAHNEWYTPPHIVEAAREVLGGRIDFDPFSSEAANAVVKASLFLTKEDDALDFPWSPGTCFVNPPYERGVIGKAIEKTVWHLNQRQNTGIVLVNAATDAAWFQLLLDNASAVCFLRKRLKFIDGVGGSVKGNGNTRAQALFYFGCDIERFAGVFEDAGAVIFL